MTLQVLLLGASGFAGRHFRAAAEAAGVDVIGAARREGAAELRCDLLDPDAVERVIRTAGPDAIVNLAGSTSVSGSVSDPLGTVRANTFGTLILLEAAARRAPDAQVLCVSSGEAYGEVPEDELPAREELTLRPASPYAASKAAAEVICGAYERSRGLRIAVARSFNHTGPGQPDTFAASSFARQVALAVHGQGTEAKISVGNLESVRDFTDVRDVARAYLAIVDRGLTGTFNVCSGRPTAVGELVELLAQASPLPIRVAVSGERKRAGEPQALYGSPAKLARATGWRPEIPLTKTMTDLLEWWGQEVGERT